MSHAQIHEVLEGTRQVRRLEGLTYNLDVSNWTTETPTGGDIKITRLSDDTDVTNDWTSTTALVLVSGSVFALPKITVPATAEYGEYLVDLPFTGGGFDEGIPFVILRVIKPRGS